MHAPASAQAIPSATMASTVSGMPGWRLRLHGPLRAASIQILRMTNHTLAQHAPTWEGPAAYRIRPVMLRTRMRPMLEAMERMKDLAAASAMVWRW